MYRPYTSYTLFNLYPLSYEYFKHSYKGSIFCSSKNFEVNFPSEEFRLYLASRWNCLKFV